MSPTLPDLLRPEDYNAGGGGFCMFPMCQGLKITEFFSATIFASIKNDA
jgi:hypothetical protein